MKPAVRYFDKDDKPIDFAPVKQAEKHKEEWIKSKKGGEYKPPNLDQPAKSVIVDTEGGEDRPLIIVGAASDGEIPSRPTMHEAIHGSNPGAVGDMQLSYRAAYQALRQTRYMMPQGPLNNVMHAHESTHFPHRSPSSKNKDHRPGYICEPASPGFLFQAGETFEDALKISNGTHLGQLAGLLARFYRGVRTGGGVCSTISAVATGMLTTNFPNLRNYERNHENDDSDFISVKQVLKHGGNTKGTEFSRLCILNVSHIIDHSFCLVSFGDSPWMVCDPWPEEPYILPFEKNYFDNKNSYFDKDKQTNTARGIKSWQLITVIAPVEDPFGLPLMRAWDEEALTNEDAEVEGLSITPKIIDLALARYSIASQGDPTETEPPFQWDEDGWHLIEDAARSKGSSEFGDDLKFHVNKPWEHESNHILSDVTDSDDKPVKAKIEAWVRYRAKNRPAATPGEWGRHVTINQEFKGDHKLDADYSHHSPEALKQAEEEQQAASKRREMKAERAKLAEEQREKELAARTESMADTKAKIAGLVFRKL